MLLQVPIIVALVTGVATIIAALIGAFSQRRGQPTRRDGLPMLNSQNLDLPRDEFYTTSPAERDRAIEQFGYRSQGTVGYVLGVEQPGTFPVFV